MKLMGVGVFLIGVSAVTLAVVETVKLVDALSKRVPRGAPARQYEDWDDWEDY